MAAAKTPGIDRGTQAYEHLRELIVLGRLAPGSRLIETEIADRLGLSRTPIRSALQRLMQEGYISGPGHRTPRAVPTCHRSPRTTLVNSFT